MKRVEKHFHNIQFRDTMKVEMRLGQIS